MGERNMPQPHRQGYLHPRDGACPRSHLFASWMVPFGFSLSPQGPVMSDAKGEGTALLSPSSFLPSAAPLLLAGSGWCPGQSVSVNPSLATVEGSCPAPSPSIQTMNLGASTPHPLGER